MTERPQPDPRRAHADAVVTEMLANGRAESLVGQLRKDYPRLPYHRVQDAIADGFVALYHKLLPGDVAKPLAFIFKVARHTLNKELERSPTLVPLPADDGPTAVVDDHLAREHDEVRVLRREHALRYVLGVVESWKNGNLKDVTRLLIESTVYGEPLEPIEIAERLGLNEGSVRVWKQRGLERLEAHIDSLGLELSDFDAELVRVDDEVEEEDRFE